MYAYSQGSINTASALRLVQNELERKFEAEGVANPAQAAQDLINNSVTVQPVGGAANQKNGSLASFNEINSAEGNLLVEFGEGMVEALPSTGKLVEAGLGADYPTWFTGVSPGIYDPSDIVSNFTWEGKGVSIDAEATRFDDLKGVLGDDVDHHLFDHYVEEYGDELEAHNAAVTGNDDAGGRES